MFKITVHDKDRKFVGQIGNPKSLTVTPRLFPLIGSAEMVVALDHPRAGLLMADGARVVFKLHDRVELSGPIDEYEIDTDTDSLRVTVLDDAQLLRGILGWQVPGDPSTGANLSQGTREYINYVGNAESLIKNVVQANGATRLGIPGLVVAPNLGRGSTVPGGASFRMHPLPDRLFPAVAMAGIGVTLKQIGTNLVFDVFESRVYPRTLSVEGRTLKRAAWVHRRPSVSRAVIGGRGEGRAREFRRVIDTQRETTYGFVGEGFVDARNAGEDYDQLMKDITSATEARDKASDKFDQAAIALDTALGALEMAQVALEIANATGSASAKTSAQNKVATATSKRDERQAARDAALSDYNSKVSALNALSTQKPALLAEYQAAMDAAGSNLISEAAATNGLSITLAESSVFTYGEQGVLVGDQVDVKVRGKVITDTIKEAVLEWVSPNYASATPIVGEQMDPARKTAAALAALKESQRKEERT